MDKIDVTQADIDAWEIYGPKIFHCEMTGPEALAAHRATRTDATPVATDVAALVEAAKEAGDWMEGLRACGDAGNWNWLEGDEYSNLVAALAPFTKGQP